MKNKSRITSSTKLCMPLIKLGVAIAALAVGAQAVPVTYILQGVTFNDGGTASGSFVYDDATNTYSNVNITTTPGAPPLGATYKFTIFAPSATNVGLVTVAPSSGPPVTPPAGTPILILNFASPLALGVASVNLTNFATESTCLIDGCGAGGGTLRLVTAGQVVSQIGFMTRYMTHIQSGFDGDFINITNDGSSSALAPGGAGTATTSSGNLCIGVYFFDPNEELQACCACEVTPNGLISLSVKANNANNLTSEFPDSEVVKLLAWSATSTATATGSIFGPGSPIQATPGASVCNAAAPGGLADGMHAWGTTLHTVPSGFAVTETPFSPALLSAFEYSRLSSFCSYNQFAGSGNYGQCKGCQSGGLGAAAAQ